MNKAYIYENIIKKIVRQVIKEEFNKMEEATPQEKYILVDNTDMAYMGTYYNSEDAIEDAKSMAEANPYGLYSVCKSDDGKTFDYEKDCIYNTFDEGKQRVLNYIRENMKDIVKDVLMEYKIKTNNIF